MKKSKFKNVTEKSMQENIRVHLNSYSWLAKLAADNMRDNGTQGSIIQFSSIYGLVGQNLNIYRRAEGMGENMTYSIIKGGITNLQDN